MYGSPITPPSPAGGASHCARCRRRIGAHLSYPDPTDVRAGTPMPRRICYHCHQEEDRGRLRPLLTDLERPTRHRAGHFLLYRFGMVLLAAITFVVVRKTGEAAYFFYGLGGIILFFTLSMAVRPRRRRGRAADSPDTPTPTPAAEPPDPSGVDGTGTP